MSQNRLSDCTPAAILNKQLSFDEAEVYFPGCSMAWDVSGGSSWVDAYSGLEFSMSCLAGTLSACITEIITNYPFSLGGTSPVYHWAFYDPDSRKWSYL